MLSQMFGMLFLVMALPMSLAVFVVAPSAKLVILMFGSAFVWLLAALVSSIVWIAVVPLKEDNWFALIFAVGIQEAFRFGYWKLLKKAEVGLSTLADDGSGASSREKQALVAGIGFSLMSTVMQFNSVLSESVGPGSIPAVGCPNYSMFTIAALMATAFGAMNIAWSVIMHSGCEDRQIGLNSMGLIKIGYVIVTHYGTALLTLNNEAENSCASTLVPLYIVALITGVYAIYLSGIRML